MENIKKDHVLPVLGFHSEAGKMNAEATQSLILLWD